MMTDKQEREAREQTHVEKLAAARVLQSAGQTPDYKPGMIEHGRAEALRYPDIAAGALIGLIRDSAKHYERANENRDYETKQQEIVLYLSSVSSVQEYHLCFAEFLSRAIHHLGQVVLEFVV